jgi:hypothetical protein
MMLDAGSGGGTCRIEIFFVLFYPFFFFVKSTKCRKSKSGDAGCLAALNVALRKPLRDSDSGLRVCLSEMVGCYKDVVEHAKIDMYNESIDFDDDNFCRSERYQEREM